MQLAHTIRALAVKNDLTWAATGFTIVESRRIARCGAAISRVAVPHRTCGMRIGGDASKIPMLSAALSCRVGAYRLEAAGPVVQLLALGGQLLSLHSGGVVAVWRVGQYDAPEVRPCPSHSRSKHHGTHVVAFASNQSISGSRWQHPSAAQL